MAARRRSKPVSAKARARQEAVREITARRAPPASAPGAAGPVAGGRATGAMSPQQQHAVRRRG